MKDINSLEPATARKVAEPGHSCEISQTELSDLAADQAAPENESDDHIKSDVPLPSTASPMLKAMYYWVISRR